MEPQAKLSLEERVVKIETLASNLLDRLGAIEAIFKGPIPYDPIPEDFVRARLRDIILKTPGWITDPPPEDFLNVRVLDLIRRFRGGFADPAPEDLGIVRLKDLLSRIPGGGFTDPSPEDIKRLTSVELETQINRINGEILRLKSLEKVFSERLAEIRK